MITEEDQARARELLRVIDFGLQIEAFLAGPIGQCLVADAERERTALADEAVTLDIDTPEGAKRHRAIRARVGVLDHWQEFFARYITDAKAAEVLFHEGEVTGEEGHVTGQEEGDTTGG